MSRVKFLEPEADQDVYGEGEVDLGDFIEEGIAGEYVDDYNPPTSRSMSSTSSTSTPSKPRITFKKDAQVFGDENQNVGGEGDGYYDDEVLEEDDLEEAHGGRDNSPPPHSDNGNAGRDHEDGNIDEAFWAEGEEDDDANEEIEAGHMSYNDEDYPRDEEFWEEEELEDDEMNVPDALISEHCRGMAAIAEEEHNEDKDDDKDEDIEKLEENVSNLHVTTEVERKNSHQETNADIDSRSLTEQKQQVKQQIEQNLASENARLFPTQQSPKSPQSPPISNSQNFRSSVDSESIGDLKATRQHLQRMVSAEDNKSPGGGGGGDSRDSKKGAESDIDRDIRDAIERDRIFRDEQKRRLQELQQQLQQQQQEKQDQSKREITTKQTMPIQKVQPVQKVQSPPAQKVQSPQAQKVQSSPMVQKVQPQPPSSVGSSWEMPEVDRDAARLKESIIDRELREQREREKEWAHEGHVKSPSNTYDDKEQEQSAFEHREKEEERAASESVIVREIRQQEEREQELRQLRQSITADPDPSTPEPVQQQSQQSPAPQQYTSPVSPSYNIPTTKPVERVTPSAPVQSRGGGQQQSNMPKPIGYEAAISTFAHAGENLIAKEIAEQKAKEDAVRQHWKEIGMEVPLSTQDPADTPFNRPEPQLSYKQRMGLVGMGGRGGGGGVQQQRGGTYQKEVKPYKAGAGQDNGGAGPRRGSLDSEDSSKASSGDRLDARHPPSTPKVQPFVMEDDDEDAIDNRRIFFQPQNETPVEREIRLARERDMALQLERGLPVNTDNTDGARHSPASEATQPRSRPSPAPSSNSPRVAGDDKHAMKRFASSRLQFEMEREKQRELQMQGEGKISTTSQDRKSGQVRYKDIISPDAPPPQPLTSSTTKPSFAITSEVRVLQNGSSPRLTGEPVKSEPPVNKRNQHLTQAQVAQVAQDGGSSLVESLIEQELRQQREREDELRRERQQAISGRVVPNGDTATSPAPSSPSPASSTATPPPKSQSMDAIAHREKQNGNDAALKTHRRKSALAEQWEKKFGAAPQ